jgi:hypothetical protein
MYLYEAYPVFTLAADQSSVGPIIVPQELDLLAIFDVAAVGSDDVTFATAQSNTLDLNWNFSESTDDGTANDLFTLRKDGGATLVASPSAVDLNAAPTVQFTFEDAPFVVPAGQTRQLFVYGDTTDLKEDGDSIQVYFDDSTTDISFSIDSGTTNANRGDIIFRGDQIRGPTLINPS